MVKFPFSPSSTERVVGAEGEIIIGKFIWMVFKIISEAKRPEKTK